MDWINLCLDIIMLLGEKAARISLAVFTLVLLFVLFNFVGNPLVILVTFVVGWELFQLARRLFKRFPLWKDKDN